MMKLHTIRLEKDDRGVATVVLARAQRRNAFDARCIGEIRSVLAALATDADVRVVVLAAEGACFSAGADLDWMAELSRSARDDRRAAAIELASMLADLDSLPQPVIARVHGAAFGGGVGLLSACDIVIASARARFALSEVRLGLIPATIAPYVISRIGRASARRLMLTGRAFDAAEAFRLGLVDVVLADADFEAGVEDEIAELLKGAPSALAATKALCRGVAALDPADLPSFTAEQLVSRLESEAAKDGISAFLAGRKPTWRD